MGCVLLFLLYDWEEGGNGKENQGELGFQPGAGMLREGKQAYEEKMNSDLDILSNVEISSRKSETQFWSSCEKGQVYSNIVVHMNRRT